MKCQNCGNEEANIKYYENINGEQMEIMICNNCAASLGLMDFPNVLSYFFSSHPKELYENKSSNIVCNKCSYTFEDYLKTGLFGCSNCYNIFSDRIDSLLTKIHGKNRHINTQNKFMDNKVKKQRFIKKDTNNIDTITDVDELKNLLKLSIQEEKYENAAKIRDKIRDLEKVGD